MITPFGCFVRTEGTLSEQTATGSSKQLLVSGAWLTHLSTMTDTASRQAPRFAGVPRRSSNAMSSLRTKVNGCLSIPVMLLTNLAVPSAV